MDEAELSARGARWVDAAHSAIDLLVLVPAVGQEVPFTARPDDVEAHGRALFALAAGGAFGPVEEPLPADVAVVQVAALRRIDADTDALYAQVIGNRAAEYEQAERDARAWTDAGSLGDPPDTVASWAAASGMTPEAAAADILSQAVAWRGAMAQIRAQRLAAKAAVRAGAVDEALAGWSAFLTGMRALLGV